MKISAVFVEFNKVGYINKTNSNTLAYLIISLVSTMA